MESERQRGKQENNRLLENVEALRRQLSASKQEKADLEVQLEREKISLSDLESELETEKALQGEASGKRFWCLFFFCFVLFVVFLICAWFGTRVKAKSYFSPSAVRGSHYSFFTCHRSLPNKTGLT